MRRVLLALATLVSLPAPARAALPPCAYEEMIDAAPLALQVEIADVSDPDARGLCHVRADIRRAFRGDLTTGPVVIRVPCANPGGLIGPTVYTPPETLRRARFLEVYGARGQGVAGHGAGVFVIAELTHAPLWHPSADCR